MLYAEIKVKIYVDEDKLDEYGSNNEFDKAVYYLSNSLEGAAYYFLAEFDGVTIIAGD